MCDIKTGEQKITSEDLTENSGINITKAELIGSENFSSVLAAIYCARRYSDPSERPNQIPSGSNLAYVASEMIKKLPPSDIVGAAHLLVVSRSRHSSDDVEFEDDIEADSDEDDLFIDDDLYDSDS